MRQTGGVNEEPGLSFVRGLPLTRAAIEFARARHDGQRREGDSALFLLHPLEVASLLARSRYPDHVVAAAVLHDALDDTDVAAADLEEPFGPDVARPAELVSGDPAIEDERAHKDDARAPARPPRGHPPVG